jgi:hypothetical protein
MKISRVASWVGPAYVGAITSSWVAVSAYLLMAKPKPVLDNQWLTWLLGVAVATPIATALATTMLVLDIFLLKFKVRALPTGGSAWRMAMLAPVPVAAAFWYLWPNLASSGTALALSLAAPVVGSALAVRLTLGNQIKNA